MDEERQTLEVRGALDEKLQVPPMVFDPEFLVGWVFGGKAVESFDLLVVHVEDEPMEDLDVRNPRDIETLESRPFLLGLIGPIGCCFPGWRKKIS